jgi:hypothetical protein
MEKKAAFPAAFFSLLFPTLAGGPRAWRERSLSSRAHRLGAGSAFIQTQTGRLSWRRGLVTSFVFGLTASEEPTGRLRAGYG